MYANNLHQFGVDISPQELIAKALTSFSEIRNQMNITAGLIAKERSLPNADYRAVLAELKKQQIPADKVMPLYDQRLAQIEAAVREQKIVTLPTRKAVIRMASVAENAQQPAPHMNPPRLIGNTGEYGEFVLTTGMPPDANGKTLAFDDFSHQAGTWTLTAHEARPGHELQFAKMIETGVPCSPSIASTWKAGPCMRKRKCNPTSRLMASCLPCRRACSVLRAPSSIRWSTLAKFRRKA